MTIAILILATIFLPAAILIDRADHHVDWNFPWNSWLVYVFIVNTTVLMVGGEYIVSTVAYPYSNSILVRNLTVQTNKKLGLELTRQIDRMSRMIKDMIENQSADSANNIMSGNDEIDETQP